MESEEFLLDLSDISKIFPGVTALSNVSLTLRPGEILGLVGENGAGKSTLIRIITGVYPRDTGSIRVKGREVEMRNPHEARMVHKIAYISQESSLCPDLSIAENIAMGDWKHRGGFVGWKAMNDQAAKLLRDLQLEVDPRTLVRTLRPADRQLVEIARALSIDAQILLMDEPTSWLSQSEKVFLFERMNLLKAMGVGIIFISHFLDEVLTICDRVQVLRDGQYIGVFDQKDLTRNLLIEKMLGQKKLRRSEGLSDDVLDKVVSKSTVSARRVKWKISPSNCTKGRSWASLVFSAAANRSWRALSSDWRSLIKARSLLARSARIGPVPVTASISGSVHHRGPQSGRHYPASLGGQQRHPGQLESDQIIRPSHP